MIRQFFHEYRSFYGIYASLAGSFLFLFFLYRLPKEFLGSCFIVALTLLLLVSIGLGIRFYQRLRILQDGLLDLHHPLFHKPIDQAYLALIEKERLHHQEERLGYKEQEETLQALVKTWSHQMKVPLSALSLMCQTNHLTTKDVTHQLQRLDHYLANLLHYLKLSNRTSDFRFEEVEVREILVSLIKKYRSQFLQREISVSIQGSWMLKTDRKWLSFALAQLLDNALKYNKKGGSIHIELQQGVTIQDTGIGILAEDIPRLFDEGFTGYNGREHQKATGFGLYLTKQILDQLHLAIHISSQVEEGTCVTVYKQN